MAQRRPWHSALPVLVFLLWVGFVLLRYQGVESPEPFAAFILLGAWLACLTLASLGAGLPVWRWVSPRGSLEVWQAPLIAMWGAASLMAVAAALSPFGLFRPMVLLVILLASAAAGGAALVRSRTRLSCNSTPRLLLPAAALLGAAVLTLLALPTAAPFYDQLHYHLAFPFHWLRAGHITTFPRHAYSFLPANMGLLFAYALAALGPWAAQAIHWWMGVVAVLLVGQIATRIGGPRAAAWAAAVLAVTPVVVLVSTWAAADLGTVAFAAAGWAMLVHAQHTVPLLDRGRWWLLAGAMAGVAAGCKLLAIATVGIPMFAAVVLLGGTLRARLRRAVFWAAGAALALAPWLLRSAVLTGNPVYPFFPTVFAHDLSPDALRAAEALAQGVAASTGSGLDLQTIGTFGTFRPYGEGVVGPLYLALLPPALWVAWRRRRGASGLLAIGVFLGVLGWAVGPPRARYLLPVLAPLAALCGAAIQQLTTRAPRRTRPWLAALLASATVWTLMSGTSPLELTRIACSLGRSSGDALMRQNASYWPAVSFVNRDLPPTARLLLVGESRGMYLDRELEIEDPVRRPLLVELAEASSSSADICRALHALGVTHVLINWQEARRIAAYNGRDDYFEPLSPSGHERLAGFLHRYLVRVFLERPVEVLALGGCDQ